VSDSLSPSVDAPPAAATAQPTRVDAQVAQVLRRLGHTVQRATIYPPHHPAVVQAVDTLYEHLRPLLQQATVSLIVSRRRLLVAHGAGTPAELALPWFSARLHDRGVASLSLDAALDQAGTRTVVQWLAQPGAMTETDEVSPSPGARVTRFDYSRARFREEPTSLDTSTQTEAELAWGAIANALAADWCVTRSADTGGVDPSELADEIRASMSAREGTGVSDLSARVISQAGRLSELPEAVRAVVRQKLASFVSRLAPELRGQLLTVVPNDNPDKLQLLAEIVDALPSHDMLEVMQSVDLNTSGAPRQFVTLMRKMVSLAASGSRDESSAPDTTHSRFGLPAHMLLQGDTELRNLLRQLFAHQASDATFVPASYQQHIEHLATHAGAGEALEFTTLDDASDAEHVSQQVNWLSLHLLRQAPTLEGSASFLRRLRDHAPRELDAGRLTNLGEVAGIIEQFVEAAGRDLPAETARLADEYLTFCAEPPVVEAVLAAIEEGEGTADERLVTLLRVGHVGSASAVVARLQRLEGEPARQRLADVLARLPSPVFAEAVVPALDEAAGVARTVLAAVARIDRERGLELAQGLVAHGAAEVRLGALQLLFSVPVTSGRFDRLLRLALDDEDPRVVDFGVQRARERRPLAGVPAMTAFLSAARAPQLTPMQRQIVRLLREHASPDTRDALVSALAARTRVLDGPARQVSWVIQAALESFDDDEAVNAARAWRRSAAGLYGWLRGDAKEAV
jgi:hypothetical protein